MAHRTFDVEYLNYGWYNPKGLNFQFIRLKKKKLHENVKIKAREKQNGKTRIENMETKSNWIHELNTKIKSQNTKIKSDFFYTGRSTNIQSLMTLQHFNTNDTKYNQTTIFRPKIAFKLI